MLTLKDFADLAAKADIVVLEASSADHAASFGMIDGCHQ